MCVSARVLRKHPERPRTRATPLILPTLRDLAAAAVKLFLLLFDGGRGKSSDIYPQEGLEDPWKPDMIIPARVARTNWDCVIPFRGDNPYSFGIINS